ANKTLERTSKGLGINNIYLAIDKKAGIEVFSNLYFTQDARYRSNGDIKLFISNGKGYWIDQNTFIGTKTKYSTLHHKIIYVVGKAD
ncbi:type III effector, partial [Erwinia amylovora]|nr:type III effector [Erwinia amylovora]